MDTIRVRHKNYRKAVKWTDSLTEFKSLIFNLFSIMNPTIKYYSRSDLLTTVNTQADFINARNTLRKENSFFIIESQVQADLNYLKDIPLVQSINEKLEDKVSIVIDEVSYVKPYDLEIPEEEVIEVAKAGDPNISNFIRMKDKVQVYENKKNVKIGYEVKDYIEDEKIEEIVDYRQNAKYAKNDCLFEKQEEIRKVEESKNLNAKHEPYSIISNLHMQSSTFTIINKSIGSFNHQKLKPQHPLNPQCASCNCTLIKTSYIQCQICINYQLCLACTNIVHHSHPTKIINPSHQLDEIIEKIKSLGFDNHEEISKALSKSNNNYNSAVKLLLSLD